ncbi:hypothetical protein EVAR_52411_1 [Eumeta japonica]|uniref:Uncharacterized protein n=1 Tax=Eumeta variegata TaxID=151549 RepID=A0A4C1YBW7_EUMVA|nr:hypothetical protein EVAR_52411_1 [Eumeta japonica]
MSLTSAQSSSCSWSGLDISGAYTPKTKNSYLAPSSSKNSEDSNVTLRNRPVRDFGSSHKSVDAIATAMNNELVRKIRLLREEMKADRQPYRTHASYRNTSARTTIGQVHRAETIQGATVPHPLVVRLSRRSWRDDLLAAACVRCSLITEGLGIKRQDILCQ